MRISVMISVITFVYYACSDYSTLYGLLATWAPTTARIVTTSGLKTFIFFFLGSWAARFVCFLGHMRMHPGGGEFLKKISVHQSEPTVFGVAWDTYTSTGGPALMAKAKNKQRARANNDVSELVFEGEFTKRGITNSSSWKLRSVLRSLILYHTWGKANKQTNKQTNTQTHKTMQQQFQASCTTKSNLLTLLFNMKRNECVCLLYFGEQIFQALATRSQSITAPGILWKKGEHKTQRCAGNEWCCHVYSMETPLTTLTHFPTNA